MDSLFESAKRQDRLDRRMLRWQTRISSQRSAQSAQSAPCFDRTDRKLRRKPSSASSLLFPESWSSSAGQREKKLKMIMRANAGSSTISEVKPTGKKQLPIVQTCGKEEDFCLGRMQIAVGYNRKKETLILKVSIFSLFCSLLNKRHPHTSCSEKSRETRILGAHRRYLKTEARPGVPDRSHHDFI